MKKEAPSTSWEVHIPFKVDVVQNHEHCPDFFLFAALKGEEDAYSQWMPQIPEFCPYCGKEVIKEA